MDNAAQFNSKVKQFLEKVSSSEQQIVLNQQHLAEFLNHLQSQNTEKSPLLDIPVFTEWVIKTVQAWNLQKKTYHESTVTFILNLTSLLAVKENRFLILQNDNILLKLLNLAEIKQSAEVCPKKVACISLLCAYLEHKSGLELIVTNKLWDDVLKLGLITSDERFLTKTCTFLSKLLEKVCFNERLCGELFKRIMEPLERNMSKYFRASCRMSQAVASLNLKSSLKLLGNVVEDLLKGTYHSEANMRVLELFLKVFCLEERLPKLMLIAQNQNLVFDLAKITFVMQFLQLYFANCNNQFTLEELNLGANKIFDNFTSYVAKAEFQDVMKFCHFGQFYFNLIKKKFTELENKKSVKHFAAQLLLIQSVPSYCMITQRYPNLEAALESEEIRWTFMQKIMDFSTPDCRRLFYVWRNRLLRGHNLVTLGIEFLVGINEFRCYFSRDEAVLVVQIFIYIMKDTVFTNEKTSSNFSEQDCDYFLLIFEILARLIEEFKITWKDGFETVDVLDFTFNILNSTNIWTEDVVVKALNLMNVTIKNYMTPSLALLVDRVNDSTLVLLGSFLFEKLQSSNSKLKETALNVTSTISHLSCEEFITLQNVIMDAHLPSSIISLAMFDDDISVRKAAIQVLEEMVKINTIWRDVLLPEELPKTSLDMVLNEPEGSNRKAILKLLCNIYDYQRFPVNLLDQLFEIMKDLAITDPNWEVRLQSLCFWDKVITNELHDQGMIDGKFPEVTFCKRKKIIIMTCTEIQKRLKCALEEITLKGGLRVLIAAIKQDSDLDVTKKAVAVTDNLINVYRSCGLCDDCNASVLNMAAGKFITLGHLYKLTKMQFNNELKLKTNCFKNCDKIVKFLDEALTGSC